MTCPNCGTEIKDSDKFCFHCGQKNVSMRIRLKDFLANFFEEYFSFDTRFFRSIGPLLFQPGYLTKQYFEGKRKRFLDPLRFYVFVSFVTFLLAGFTNMNFLNVDSSTDIKKELQETETIEITTGSGGMQEVKMNEFLGALEQIVDHQDKINSNMMRYFSIALFVLMPLFALINFLIFFGRKKYYLEHLIFSFHIHIFFLLLSIFAIIIYLITDYNVFWLVLICLTVFTLLAMRNYYATTFFGALWRFLSSIAIYTFFLLIAVAGIALLAIYFSGATNIFNLGA